MNKYPCCKHCGHSHGKGHNTPCNMCIVDNYQSAEPEYLKEPEQIRYSRKDQS